MWIKLTGGDNGDDRCGLLTRASVMKKGQIVSVKGAKVPN